MSIHLPCKHVLAVRTFLNMDPYEPTIVADRWKLNYVLKHSNLFAHDESHEAHDNHTEDLITVATNTNKRKILSQQEKFRILFVKCKLMASLGAEAQGKDFSTICSLFDDIILNLQKCTYTLNIVNEHEPHVLNMDNNNIDEDIGEGATTTENHIFNQHLEGSDNVGEETTKNDQYTGVFQNEQQSDKESYNFTWTKDPSDHIVVIESSTLDDENQIIDSVACQSTTEISNPDMYCVAGNCDAEMSEIVDQPNVDLTKIKVFPAKPRGRPKGYNKTVIGLTKKKAPRNMLFDKKQKNEKKSIILSWILRDTKNQKNLINSLDNIKPPDQIDVRLLEINLNLIKNYFTPEIWPNIKEIKQQLAKKVKWICPECNKEVFKSQPSVRCDSCLHWVHVAHIDKNALNTKNYFCIICTK